MSWAWPSNATMPTMTPLSPPTTKIRMPPTRNHAGTFFCTLPDASVAIQANTCTPAGTATAIDAAEK